jgi:serine O-acetyltransferase
MNGARLDDLVRRLHDTHARCQEIDAGAVALPDRRSAGRICDLLLDLLFPGFFADDGLIGDGVAAFRRARLARLDQELGVQVERALRYAACRAGQDQEGLAARALALAEELLGDLVRVSELVTTDVEAAFDNDPAAIERETIVLSYPCIQALAVQRFAHCLYQRAIPMIPRVMTEVAHGRTGIDIHPGAAIDESFFIDHGTGVVIGETSVIGKRCVLYHGVTLGAWNPTAKDDHGALQRGPDNKRHPDLEDHVTVYSGATILGGTTRIGHHCVIGGNVWLTHSVEPHSVVMNEDPRLVISTRKHRPKG